MSLDPAISEDYSGQQNYTEARYLSLLALNYTELNNS